MEKSKQQKNKVRFVVVREFSGEKSMREAFEQLIERQTCEHFEEWRHQREMAEKAAGELSSEVQHFSRGGKSEALSGSVIEHIHDLGNFLLGDLPEVGTSRKKLTYQAVQVFYRRLLPRGMGTREIEGDPQGFLHFLITGKFFPPIPGHGLQWELPVLKQEPKSPHGLLGRAAS